MLGEQFGFRLGGVELVGELPEHPPRPPTLPPPAPPPPPTECWYIIESPAGEQRNQLDICVIFAAIAFVFPPPNSDPPKSHAQK